tara:strand:+ start:215 stop:460 length:246 start_codon:yes stop_codon:yes gene_type:complete
MESSIMVFNNVGSTDRMIRAFAGGGLAVFELTGNLGNYEQYFHFFAIGMAVWLLGTGMTGNCPTYTVMGVSTCPHMVDEEE